MIINEAYDKSGDRNHKGHVEIIKNLMLYCIDRTNALTQWRGGCIRRYVNIIRNVINKITNMGKIAVTCASQSYKFAYKNE